MATTELKYHVTFFNATGDTEGYEPFWSYQILSTHTGWSIHDEESLKKGFRQIQADRRLGMKVLNHYRLAVDDFKYAHKNKVLVDMTILLVRFTGTVSKVVAELKLDNVRVTAVYPIQEVSDVFLKEWGHSPDATLFQLVAKGAKATVPREPSLGSIFQGMHRMMQGNNRGTKRK